MKIEEDGQADFPGNLPENPTFGLNVTIQVKPLFAY